MNPLDILKEYDRRWPNRHKEIHASPCKECPTQQGVETNSLDEESIEVNSYPRSAKREHLFVCFQRPNKLCKGLCDYMGFKEEDLK